MNAYAFRSASSLKTMFAFGLGLATLLSAASAEAACGSGAPPSAPAVRWDTPSSGAFRAVAYRTGEAQFVRVMDEGDRNGDIVGTWRFTFTSDGTAYPAPIPYGAQVDFGTQQWHSDGTEFMISGGRAPSTGDVCMGEWRRTGNRTYKLKHLALAYASSDTAPPVGPVTPAAFVGPAIIKETVTLSRDGSKFEGHFTLDQYARDEITVLEHISGTVNGTRFAPD